MRSYFLPVRNQLAMHQLVWSVQTECYSHKVLHKALHMAILITVLYYSNVPWLLIRCFGPYNPQPSLFLQRAIGSLDDGSSIINDIHSRPVRGGASNCID